MQIAPMALAYCGFVAGATFFVWALFKGLSK